MTYFIEDFSQECVRRYIEVKEIREEGSEVVILFTSNFMGCDPWKLNSVRADRYYISPLEQKTHWKDCGMNELHQMLSRSEPVFKPETLEREAFLREWAKFTKYPRYEGDLELTIVSGMFCVKEVRT